MQANDSMLDQYLFDHRISPPQEFSAQVDALCERLIQREGRNSKAHGARRSKRARNNAKRVLYIAASLLFICALLIMAIPSAKAAVSEWVNNLVRFGDYIGQTSEERDGEPELDSIITKIEDDGRQIEITDIGSSDEARRAAENFGIRLDEVLYTGKSITITGWFTGTSGKFLLDERTGGDTVHEDSEYTMGVMNLTLPDGTVYNGVATAYFDDEMEQLCSDSMLKYAPAYDAAGNLVSTNTIADSLWYEWLKTHEVRFVMSATPEDRTETAPLSGLEIAALSFHEYYHDTKTASAVTLFKANLGTVSIDADAYAAVTNEQSGGQQVSLTGTHRMYIHEWETLPTGNFIHSYVKDLDFSGASIAVDSVTFTPTGMEVTLRMDLPQAWSRTERIVAIQGGENGGIGFAVLIDGEPIQHAFLSISSSKENPDTENKDDPFLTSLIVFSNSTLSRSQWDAVKTISFIPYTGWPTELILEDLLNDRRELERFKLDPGVVVTEQVDVTGTKRADWIEDRMDDAAITIQLDDYR